MRFVSSVAVLLFAPFALAQQTPPPTSPAPTSPAPTSPAPTTPASPPAATADLPDSPASQVHTAPQPTGATVLFDTSMGRITCRFFDKQAPEMVASFTGLATGTKDWQDPTTHKTMHRKPMFNGTQFHRVIPEFMIQGGDPTATGMGDPGFYMKDEFDPDLNFDVPGRLAMANSGPNTNGSQFFITEIAYEQLNQHYTIIGQCDDPGVLVVKTIARVERDRRDKPLTPVTLDKVTIVAAGKPIPPAPPLPVPAAPAPVAATPAPTQ